tara:strand:- start:347 stop:595 length:249 start_codon:yes stop_codon:yes gene_type:complete
MAFTAATLKKVAGAGTGNVWHYNSEDAPAAIAGSGYFTSITNELKQWDTILAVGTTGGTVTVDLLVVTSATGAATVTCTNGT